jgi:hypothetical protein
VKPLQSTNKFKASSDALQVTVRRDATSQNFSVHDKIGRRRRVGEAP